jgi:hypothetical protein
MQGILSAFFTKLCPQKMPLFKTKTAKADFMIGCGIF